jgi:hypothetical protein
MPTVYRIQCDACGRAPESEGGVVGYVATGGRQAGTVLPDSYLALRIDNGSLVPLPHPLETAKLKEQGFTWRQASSEKRLYRIRFKVCKCCGVLHEERRLDEGRYGCTLSLIVGVAAVFLVRWAAHRPWASALFTGYLGMLVTWCLAALVARWPLRKENSKDRLRQCAACHSRELVTLVKASGQVLPCPYCHEPQMRYSIAGIS